MLTELVFGTILSVAILGGTSQSTTPDMSGTWNLDAEKSDDAESQVLKGAGENTSHGLQHFERQQQLERLVSLARALDVIEIEQSDEDFTIFDRANNTRIYYLDGEKHPRQTPWGASLETVATWKEGSLVVRSRGEDVGEVTEIYGLEGRQLAYMVSIDNPLFENEVTVKHYYDRASE